jgi:hypothetical protein
MSSFKIIKKQKQSQKQVPSKQALPFRATSDVNHCSDPILHLQRTIGNQAVQRILRSRSGEPKVGLADTSTMEGRRRLVHGILSTRSMESSAIINRQKTGSDETSGNPQGSGNKPKDLKQISKDLCINETTDDTKARCQFSSAQLNMVRIIKEHALRTCTRSIAAINMPGNEDQVKRIARDYFNIHIKLTERTKRKFIGAIKAVADKLGNSAIECGTCQDKHCNSGAIAHVDEARTFLVVCPQFFNGEINKAYLTPRILIHEAGHLAQLDENTNLREEFYCFQGATKEEKCPVPDALHNVDAWSHFIEELAYTI